MLAVQLLAQKGLGLLITVNPSEPNRNRVRDIVNPYHKTDIIQMADNKGAQILEATNHFYDALLSGDFDTVEDMLSPDCRIQDQLVGGRGTNSLDMCMEKLRELHSKTSKAKVNMSMKSLRLMRNGKQVRFLAMPRVAFVTMTIGFALDWHGGIIVCIVICRDTTEDAFLKDSTTAPAPAPAPAPVAAAVSPAATPVKEPPQSSPKSDTSPPTSARAPDPAPSTAPLPAPIERPISDSIASSPPKAPAAATGPPPQEFHKVQSVRTSSTDSTGSNSQTEQKGWYPGKLLGRRPSSLPNTTTSSHLAVPVAARRLSAPSAVNGQVSSVASYFAAGNEIWPPYLVPQPPPIAPTLVIRVTCCTDLKSRLIRVIKRPINSYVTVQVGNQSRQTPIVSGTPNPVFPNERWIFEISPDTEFIHFIVKDKHLIDEDTLAEVDVPLASLRCRVSSSEPMTQLTIPLVLREKRFGKGLKRVGLMEQGALLNIEATRVDIMQWWVLEELRMRDEAREREIKQREEERLKKQAEEMKRQEEEAASNGIKKQRSSVGRKRGKSVANTATAVVMNPPTNANGNEKLNKWMPSSEVDSCFGCSEPFSFFKRKHHCRVCGLVFCNDCASLYVLIDGVPLRACQSCATPVDSSSQSQSQSDAAQSTISPASSATAETSGKDKKAVGFAVVAADGSEIIDTEGARIDRSHSMQAVNRSHGPDSDDEDSDDEPAAADAASNNDSNNDSTGRGDAGAEDEYDDDSEDLENETHCVIS
jgi:hypothetical protein